MGAPEANAPLSPAGTTYSYEHEGDRQFATTLARGLEVLRCFTPLEPMLGNKEISVRTGLPKPTVSRLTYTLTKLGYLRHNMRLGKYQLGSAVLSIGYPLLASMSVRQVARPFMKELADYSGGSVSMGIRDRLNMVYVESSRNGNTLTMLPDIGTAVPIAQAAIGRAFLAACTPAEREAVLNQIKVKEPELHRKFRPAIDKSLEDIRSRGFCVSIGELRKLGSEGKLTAERVFPALLRATERLGAELDQRAARLVEDGAHAVCLQGDRRFVVGSDRGKTFRVSETRRV